MEDPARALQHLSRYPLSELVQMPTMRLWLSPPSVTATNEEAAERAFDLYWHATQALRVEEHGRALMAPKLVAKERTMAAQSRPKAILEGRAVGRVHCRRRVEDLLSTGHTERAVAIHHQLRVFEPFEHGLLATWETPQSRSALPINAVR
jgi:hypothetical protein